MKEKIYEAIKLQNGKLSFRNLKKKFRIGDDNLKDILLELKLEGRILQTGDKYMLFPEDNHIGRIELTKASKKVIYFEGEKLTIVPSHLSKVLRGDVVSFKINYAKACEITSIVKREFGNITCEVVYDNKTGEKSLLAYYKNFEVKVSQDIIDGLDFGDVVLVNVSDVDGEATFVKKLYNRNQPNQEEATIALNYGFDDDYSDKYMRELEKIPTEVSEEDIKKTTDLRHWKLFTIDGKNTKDMDDSVGEVSKLEDGTIRFVSGIAHPTYYIPMFSEIFNRIADKTTSLYMNNTVYHMLHKVLANGICSLNPNEDRIALSFKIDISLNGDITDFEVYFSTINSKKKMTYEDVDEFLVKGITLDGYENYTDDLLLLYEAAMRVENALLNNGAIKFVNHELSVEYAIDNSIINAIVRCESPAMRLIEYLMISTNVCGITFLKQLGLPVIYRNHDLPNVRVINKKIDVINQFIDERNRMLKEEASRTGKPYIPLKRVKYLNDTNIHNPRKIQAILNSVDEEIRGMVSDTLLQSMQRARYSTVNNGHYALALLIYGHITSPDRRGADFMNHYSYDLVFLYPEKVSEIDFDELNDYYEKFAQRASLMERNADAAEREAQNYLLHKYLDEHRDEEYEAVVLEISNKIKIRVNYIDTYIKFDCLSSNFKKDRTGKWYDIDSGLVLKTGVKLNVTVKAVDLSSRDIRVTVNGIINSKKLVKK